MSLSNNSLPGVILLAHGSREPETEIELRELCRNLAESKKDSRFEIAFLNQEPKLDQALDSLVSQGCAQVRILPLLVFTGRHLREDIPNQINELRSKHANVNIELEPHLYRLSGFANLLLPLISKDF